MRCKHLLFAAGLVLVNRAEVSLAKPGIQCKTIQTQLDCNTCEYKRCTNGVKQWEDSTMSCTTLGCVKNEAYDPDEWEEASPFESSIEEDLPGLSVDD